MRVSNLPAGYETMQVDFSSSLFVSPHTNGFLDDMSLGGED